MVQPYFWKLPVFWDADTRDYSNIFRKIEHEPEDVYIPFCIDNKWGYKSSNGKVFIEPVYDFVRVFDEHGLARVKLDGKWGMIRKDGHFFISPVYDKIKPYNERTNIYRVEKDKKIGYINEDKQIIVPLVGEEDTVSGFHNYERDEIKSIRLKNKYGFIGTNGLLIPPIFDRIVNEIFNYKGYCKVIYKGKEHYVSTDGYIYPFNLKMLFPVLDKKNGINIWDIPWDFEPIEVDPDDYFIPFHQDGKWGYKSTGGKIFIQPEYEYVRLFDENELAFVCYKGKWGAIRKDNRVIIPFEYDRIHPYDEIMCGYQIEQDGLSGFINQYGKVFVPVCFRMDSTSLYGILQKTKDYKQRSVIKDGKYGFINASGILCPPILDKIRWQQFIQLRGYEGTYCQVYYNGKRYYLSDDGYLYKYTDIHTSGIVKIENRIPVKDLIKD